MSVNVELNTHGRAFSDSRKRAWNTAIKDIVEELNIKGIRKIIAYNYSGKHNHRGMGDERKLMIFAGTTMDNAGDKVDFNGRIFGMNTTAEWIYPPVQEGNSHVIRDDEGLAIAEYFSNKRVRESTLNILFDVFAHCDASYRQIMENIFKQLKVILEEPLRELTWSTTQNKDALLNAIIEENKKNASQDYEATKNSVNDLEYEVQERQQRLSEVIRRLDNQRRKLVGFEGFVESQVQKLKEDIHLIVNHEKIVDLSFVDNILEVKTTDIYAYDENGNKYYMGKYTIRLKPERSEVRFFGDNPRQGYWTSQDPHPHVNGRDGTPCLGNLTETIAELSAQNQLYALVLSAIDFLESANTRDGAGEKVVNWDRVDENNEVIVSGENDDGEEYEEDVERCDECEGEFDEEDMRTAYNEVIYQRVGVEVRVCPTCYDENYHYDGDLGVSIHDEARNVTEETTGGTL
jgi:hypothetical protein